MEKKECLYSDFCQNFNKETCSEFTCDKFSDYSDFPEFFNSEDDFLENI